MRIVSIDTWTVFAGRRNWVIVRINTDSHLFGLGEATLDGYEGAVERALADLKESLLGLDPMRIEALHYKIFRDGYWRSGPVLQSALAGIDIALWDLKGKALAVPVYELLGGKIRDRIALYANGWFHGAKTPEELAIKAKQTISRGYSRLKWDPFTKADLTLSPEDFQNAIAQVQKVREAVGSEVELLIEGHGRLTPHNAIRVGLDVAKFKPYFFEEPVPPSNIEALLQVKAKLPFAVAAGERMTNFHEFFTLISSGAVDIVQPDLCNMGGLTAGKKVAALAEAAFISFMPHNTNGPIGTAAAVHLMATLPNALWLEIMTYEIPWAKEVFPVAPKPNNGFIEVPDLPGLGIEFNPDAAKIHGYKPVQLGGMFY